MDRSESVKELVAALVAVQGKLRPAAKDSENPHFKSRYADLASIWEVCREPLADHGLAVVQTPELLPEGVGYGLCLRTTLYHASGEFLSCLLPLSFQAGNMQAMGSALTYARRYGLAAMVGVVAEDDDDGHLASKLTRASDLPPPPPRESAPPPRPDPVPDRGVWPGRPSSGKALFAWVKAMEQKHEMGVLKYLNDWGRRQGFAGKMIDWTCDQVALAHAEASRMLDGGYGVREPGSDDE